MGRSLGFFPVAFVTGTYWGDKNSHRQCPRSRQDSVTGNKDHFDLPEFITQINNCQLQSAHSSAVFLTVLTSLHRHVESNLRVRPFPRIDFMSVISSPLRKHPPNPVWHCLDTGEIKSGNTIDVCCGVSFHHRHAAQHLPEIRSYLMFNLNHCLCQNWKLNIWKPKEQRPAQGFPTDSDHPPWLPQAAAWSHDLPELLQAILGRNPNKPSPKSPALCVL